LKNYFSATLDTVSKIITGLVTPLFTIFPVILFVSLRTQKDDQYIPYFVGVMLLLWIIFGVCYLFWVTGYSIQDSNLVIHRKGKAKVFSLDSIKNATAVSKEDMGFVIRNMGNGGLFGYTGFFSNKQFGRMQYFVTSTEKIIVLHLTDDKIICISIDDSVGFLKALGKKPVQLQTNN
jgi:uncharacterized membrane protein (Fun14 family)